MTTEGIAWENESFESGMMPDIEVGSTEFASFSKQKTTTSYGAWKQETLKSLKKIRKETDFRATETMTGDDARIGSIKTFGRGVAAEPHIDPNELVRFFKEKPLVPFLCPREETENVFKEATYQWAKKKMSGSKQQ